MISKFIVFALMVLNTQILLARELVIVSDLDETLRMANVEHHVKAGIRLIGGVKPYSGLVSIFQEIKKHNPDAKFYYLSNSYPFLYNGKKWSQENGLPEGKVLQRSLKDKSDTFKPAKLKEMAEAHPNATFLMFGDNVERDPEFYRQFKQDYQLSDAQIFIRDARLIFPQDIDVTFFQTDAQITDDLNMSAETTEKVKNLAFSKLVPRFLLNNLKKRLIKECKTAAVNCVEIANTRVREVIEQITPNSTSELIADQQ